MFLPLISQGPKNLCLSVVIRPTLPVIIIYFMDKHLPALYNLTTNNLRAYTGLLSQHNIPHIDERLQIFIDGEFVSERKRSHAHSTFISILPPSKLRHLQEELVRIAQIKEFQWKERAYLCGTQSSWSKRPVRQVVKKSSEERERRSG